MSQTLFFARLAERAERYDEMCKYVKQAVDHAKDGGNAELRNLLSVAYKNAIGRKRTAFRLLSEVARKETSKGLLHGAECAAEYRDKVANDIAATAEEALRLCDKLLDRTSSADLQARAFLMKLRGDQHRYIAEVTTPNPQRRQAAIADATRAYDETLKLGLPEDDPAVMGCILNKAVFYYEVLDNKRDAIQMLEDTLGRVPQPYGGNQLKSSKSVIVTLFEDNLKLWRAGKQ